MVIGCKGGTIGFNTCMYMRHGSDAKNPNGHPSGIKQRRTVLNHSTILTTIRQLTLRHTMPQICYFNVQYAICLRKLVQSTVGLRKYYE